MIDGASTRLLLAARDGSSEALGELLERVSARLLAFIRLRLGPGLRAHMESRDILQLTLLKAFQGVDRLEASDSGSLMAWLARIALNQIRDQAEHHRRQRRDAALQVPLDEATAAVADSVRSQASRVVLNEELARLEGVLEAVDEHYREVILLRHFEELSFKEIAQRLGRSPDACRMLLSRALAAVTLKLGERA